MTDQTQNPPLPTAPVSIFDVPTPDEGSPIREVFDKEKLAFEQNNLDQNQRRKHDDEIHGMRKLHAWLLFGLTVCWVIFLWIAVLLDGFGQWFSPIPESFQYIKFKISDVRKMYSSL